MLDKVVSSKGKTVLKKKSKLTNTVDASGSTWDAIHTGMREVITEGTVYKYFKDVFVYYAQAKTT